MGGSLRLGASLSPKYILCNKIIPRYQDVNIKTNTDSSELGIWAPSHGLVESCSAVNKLGTHESPNGLERSNQNGAMQRNLNRSAASPRVSRGGHNRSSSQQPYASHVKNGRIDSVTMVNSRERNCSWVYQATKGNNDTLVKMRVKPAQAHEGYPPHLINGIVWIERKATWGGIHVETFRRGCSWPSYRERMTTVLGMCPLTGGMAPSM